MPYADTDFLLALLKPEDWLKDRAQKILKKYKGDLWTSAAGIIEILLVCREFGLSSREVVISLYEILDLHIMPRETALAAAHLIDEKGLKVFDAFHAAYAGDDEIISSDEVFDKIGLRRIRLR